LGPFNNRQPWDNGNKEQPIKTESKSKSHSKKKSLASLKVHPPEAPLPFFSTLSLTLLTMLIEKKISCKHGLCLFFNQGKRGGYQRESP
jgi:hypothetical protein